MITCYSFQIDRPLIEQPRKPLPMNIHSLSGVRKEGGEADLCRISRIKTSSDSVLLISDKWFIRRVNRCTADLQEEITNELCHRDFVDRVSRDCVRLLDRPKFGSNLR
jgi:hypothetical protein